MIRNLIIPYRSVQLPTITSTSPLPTATSGRPYSFQFQATGGSYPYTWSSSGTGAFSLSASGLFTGTPITTGTFNFTITATDSFFPTGGNSVSALFQIQVVQPNAPSITTTSPLPGASVGTFYSFTMSATGGTAPYTWAITSDTPNTGGWLSIDPATGILTGTPTTAETETVTIKVTDSLSVPSSPVSFSLSVATPGVYNFDHFISPTGDDTNDGLTPATAWSAGAINTKTFNVLGVLPGTYTGTQSGGVFSRFYDQINNATSLGNTTLHQPAGTTIAGCDANKNYSPRTAFWDPSAAGSNTAPPLRQGAVINMAANCILDGIVFYNYGSSAIGSVGANSQVLNCYATGGVGPYGSIYNNASMATTATGVYFYNTAILHARILQPPAMTVTFDAPVGGFTPGCTIVNDGWGHAFWPYDMGNTTGGGTEGFGLILSTGQVLGDGNANNISTNCIISNPSFPGTGTGYGGTHITFPANTAIGAATNTVTPKLAVQGPYTNYSLYGQQGCHYTVEGCTFVDCGFGGIKTDIGQMTWKNTYVEAADFAISTFLAFGSPNISTYLTGFNADVGNTTSLDHCIIVGPVHVMNLAGGASNAALNGTFSANHCTFYTKFPVTNYLRSSVFFSVGGAGSVMQLSNCLWGGGQGNVSQWPLTAGVFGTFTGSGNVYNNVGFRQSRVGFADAPTGPVLTFAQWSVGSGVTETGSIDFSADTNVFTGVPAPGNISTFTPNANATNPNTHIVTGAMDNTVGKNGVAVGVNYIVIAQAGLPAATVGSAYSAPLSVAGYAVVGSNYTWSMTASPDWLLWLSINPSTGTLSGTPFMVGTDAVTVTVTDNATGKSAIAILMLTVNHQ